MLAGLAQPLLEAFLLLGFGDVQEELDDGHAATGQQALEGVDVVVAALPHRARHQLFDADDQHVLVVRAVEEADHAQRRRMLVNAPQEVVVEFFGGRHFEGSYLDALRVDAAHDVANGAVLAAGVHRLQDDQQGVLVLGVEHFLKLAQARPVALQVFEGVLFGPVFSRVIGIIIRQADGLARLRVERLSLVTHRAMLPSPALALC